ERAVLALDPKSASERHHREYADRGVKHWPTHDGMGEVRATLRADGLLTTMAALNGLLDAARAADPKDPRSADQLRADLFVGVFQPIAAGTDLPTPLFSSPEPPPDPDYPHPDDDNSDDDNSDNEPTRDPSDQPDAAPTGGPSDSQRV